MNLLKISRGALEVREANSPLTEGELHLNTVFDNNIIDTLDEFGQKPFISLHTKVKDEIKKINLYKQKNKFRKKIKCNMML